jgi:DUF1680 family protein
LVAALLILWGAAPALGQTSSRHAVCAPVGLADARWTTGFWADRFATCREGLIPAMGEVMEGTRHSQFLHNFRIAAGQGFGGETPPTLLETGRRRGPPWNDGDFYKWLEAVAAVYAVTQDRALDRRLDAAIEILAKAQRRDGYLHTPVLIKQRNGEEAKPFEDRLDFEMYNFGHLFTAACVHHRATGKRNLLAVATRAADFLCEAFAKPTPRLARNAVCPSHYMGVVELYRVTGDLKYLRLAKTLLAMRDLVADGGDDNQDRLPLRQHTEAVGHAVRANYLYAGVADLVMETGDRELLGTLVKVWDNVATRKLYVTGGCGALFDGASPDGAKQQKAITRVHQAYGRNYQLPNSTAHNETCAAAGLALWSWRMLQLTGEARYADVLELVLHNALLAGVSLDGKRFLYTNTLRQLDRMPAELRWPRERQPFLSCYCCPPNVARLLAEASAHAYGRSGRAVWVHLYGGSVLNTELPGGDRVKLTQRTDYPWDGRVTITLDAAPREPFALRLRIPGWAKGAVLRVNGAAGPDASLPGRYVEVRRRWKAGDVVELTLPMRPVLLQAHPLVEEARGQVAVKRGPVVYCLESIDLPRGVGVLDVLIPRTASFKPRYARDLLGGVTLLEGEGQAAVEPEWRDELYRELPPAPAALGAERPQTLGRAVPLKLIPYYAWDNRGRSEMTVWLPLGR